MSLSGFIRDVDREGIKDFPGKFPGNFSGTLGGAVYWLPVRDLSRGGAAWLIPPGA